MINKIFITILFFGLIGCNSTKPAISTSKTKPQYKPISKVEVKKSSTNSVSKPVENSKSEKPTEELIATSKVLVTKDIVINYINKFKNIAQKNMQEYKIPASITLAQAILESGSGVGDLALKANNHFGIKCHKEWKGDSVRHDDDAAQECFRKYNDPALSFEDHSQFLLTRPWYNNLFKLDIADYKAWSYGLKKSGYATDPKYPAKLIGIIEKYQLYNYDNEVLGKQIVIVNISDEKLEQNTQKSNTKKHTVIKGDTLYSISKRYNISLDDLKNKNNIENNSISIGQNLILD